jgi:hypothetical protein
VRGKSGRGAGRCGEDGGKIGGVDFFLELEEGVTEAAPGDGEMQARKLPLIHCTVKIPGGLRGCARSREGLRYQEEAAESPVAAGIEEVLRQYWRFSDDESRRPGGAN